MTNSSTSPKSVVLDWLAAYNARDPHALIALYHDDAENHQVAFGAPLKGREALLESFIAFFHAFPDNFTHPLNILEDSEWATVEWEGGGTFLGELGPYAPMANPSPCKVAVFSTSLRAKFNFNAGISTAKPGFLS